MTQRFGASHAVRLYLAKLRASHIILPAAFLNAASYTGISLGIVYYLRDVLVVPAALIGVNGALFSLMYFVGCFLLAPLSRRVLPRHLLLISSLVGVLLMSVITIVSVVWVVVLVYAVIGLGTALFWPPVMGWLSAGREGRDLSRQIAHFNLSWSAGVIIGPYLAGLLAEQGPRLPLVAGAVGILAVGAMIAFGSIFLPAVRADTHRDPTRIGLAATNKGTLLRFPSWVGTVGAYAVLGAIVIVVPLYGRDTLGLRESTVGVVLLSRGLFYAIGFFVAGRTEAWHFKGWIIMVPIAILIGTTLLLAGVKSLTGYLVLLPVAGLALSGSYSAGVFHGVAGSSERARRMGIHEALLTAGMVIGSVGGAWLFQTNGVRVVFFACAALLALVLAIQIVLVAMLRSR